jgi:tetratricopeptide (TPR) repeat protein
MSERASSLDAEAFARLIGKAIDELGGDLSATESSMFVRLVEHLRSSGTPTPPDYATTALRALGGRAAQTDHSALVVELYAALLGCEPEDATIWYDLGNHLGKLSRTLEAIDAYTQALARDPGMSWAYLNRGRLLYDGGRVDDALADYVRAAHAEIDLEGFHESFATRFICHRGFRAFFDLTFKAGLPTAQKPRMLMALTGAIAGASPYGGWFLVPPIPPDNEPDADAVIAETVARVNIADILRESPYGMMVGHLHLSHDADGKYNSVVRKDEEIREALWFRPPSWSADEPDPDRVKQLELLLGLASFAEESAVPEVAWAAHYMAGAIALSAMFGQRRDWPVSVLRLSVRCDAAEDRRIPMPSRVAALQEWLELHYEPASFGGERTLGGFAAHHFRTAAAQVIALRTNRTAPTPPDLFLLDGDPILEDGEWAKGSLARAFAAEIWSSAEPLFREWVVACVLRQSSEYLLASNHARTLSLIAASDLWAVVDPTVWGAARARLIDAYYEEHSVPALQDYAGPDVCYLDYYVYEIVEDTVVRLGVTGSDERIVEAPVDVLAGDLKLLIGAHRHRDMAPEGLDARLDELLLADAPDVASAESLVITSFGYLRGIPFHALPTIMRAVDEGKLRAIAYLPSTSFLTRFNWPRSVVPNPRCLFVGYDLAEEIDIEAELEVLRHAFPQVTALLGPNATISNVREELARHDIVHFACHGDLDQSIAAGFLELADGRLYPWHVLDGNQVPATVVLNACLASSVETFEPTSDGAVGLQSAFLTAGAVHVVGGLWDVNEWSAKTFASHFYADWNASSQGVSPARAVLRAQTTLRQETTDPFLWAPHAFFGDWRDCSG